MLSYKITAFGQPLSEVRSEAPVPVGTQVLVAVGSCGVCHSDLHLFDGYFDLGGDAKLDLSGSVSLPLTLGHEIAGTVVAIGPEALGVKIGDRRVVFPWIGCGECMFCAAGDEHLCSASRTLGINRNGGYSDYVLVPDAKYLIDYAPLSEEQACICACSGLTAYSALKKAGPLSESEPLLIIGAGGVGLSAIRLARKMFAVAPIVAEIDRNKWDIARAAGASEIIDPTAPGAAKALAKATGGAASVVDFVGTGATFSFGISTVRKAGKLVCVGLMGGATTVVPAIVALKSVRIIGSYVGSLREMRELLELARKDGLPDMPVTPYALEQSMQALESLRAGHVKGRIVLKP